jgi:DUF4097 and DUF4098 domain-containing protein YvlB
MTLMVCSAVSHAALADQWAKSFTVGEKPELRVTAGDGNVTVRSSSVSTIEARVETSGWTIGPGNVIVTSRQNGDFVELDVKIPNLHFDLGHRSVHIELQVPRQTKTDIHTSDGNIRADGLHGNTRLATSDGNIEGADLDGTLDASSGDGSIRVRGRFDELNVRTGDGSIDANVQAGSRMAGIWTVHSGDGGVTLRLPDGFAVNIDAHTGDGRITVNLPITTTGGIQEHSVNGKLNGGGSVLTIHTGDGSIHLERS